MKLWVKSEQKDKRRRGGTAETKFICAAACERQHRRLGKSLGLKSLRKQVVGLGIESKGGRNALTDRSGADRAGTWTRTGTGM